MRFLVHQTEALEVVADVRHISAHSIMDLTIAVYRSFFFLAGSREFTANNPYNARYGAAALHFASASAMCSLKSNFESSTSIEWEKEWVEIKVQRIHFVIDWGPSKKCITYLSIFNIIRAFQ